MAAEEAFRTLVESVPLEVWEDIYTRSLTKTNTIDEGHKRLGEFREMWLTSTAALPIATERLERHLQTLVELGCTAEELEAITKKVEESVDAGLQRTLRWA